MDEHSDLMITDDPTTYDCSDSSIYEYSGLSVCDDDNQSGSGLSTHLPPSSGISSGFSSGITSDSDPPPPPQPKPSKQVHQTGLHSFFSVIPADEAHAMWREKKRKNRDRDEEERTRIMHQEQEWKQEKLQVRQDNNRISQQKRRKRIMGQEIQAGIRDQDGKKVQVRQISIIKASQLIYFKVVTKPEQEVQIPSRSEVASASRPRRAIVAEIKRRESVKAKKVYKPSKHDEASHTAINWRSPTFWPIIEMAACQQVGKPNLSKLVNQLRQYDPRFAYLSHQRVSEWRDQSVKDRIEWTAETIAAVKQEFLPGGHQTRYNVFVSIFK